MKQVKKQFKRDKNQNSQKLHLDKYYTPSPLARDLIDHTYNTIGYENITEVVEPSAGSGSFSHQIKGCIAYDIEPEGENIIQADFLELDIPYKKGRLFIGNPPFGDRLNLARKFMKRHYIQGDYIAYILPISQLKNNYNFFEFDLISSKDIGWVKYSNKNIHCCFNIYVRPKTGKLNKRVDMYKLPDWITIEEKISNKNPKRQRLYTGCPDIRVCSWGSAAGKTLNESEHYTKELGFYVKGEHKEDFISFIDKFEYSDLVGSNYSSSPNITIWRMRQHIIDAFLTPKNLY